jgi:hypothetical protein
VKCVVCGHGETRSGKTTVVLQRGGATVVINDVRLGYARTAAKSTSTSTWPRRC